MIFGLLVNTDPLKTDLFLSLHRPTKKLVVRRKLVYDYYFLLPFLLIHFVFTLLILFIQFETVCNVLYPP